MWKIIRNPLNAARWSLWSFGPEFPMVWWNSCAKFFSSSCTLSLSSFKYARVLFLLVLLRCVLFFVNECCLIKSVGRISAGVLRCSLYFGKSRLWIPILIPKIIQFQSETDATALLHSHSFFFLPFGLYIAGLICLLLFIQSKWLPSAYMWLSLICLFSFHIAHCFLPLHLNYCIDSNKIISKDS